MMMPTSSASPVSQSSPSHSSKVPHATTAAPVGHVVDRARPPRVHLGARHGPKPRRPCRDPIRRCRRRHAADRPRTPGPSLMQPMRAITSECSRSSIQMRSACRACGSPQCRMARPTNVSVVSQPDGRAHDVAGDAAETAHAVVDQRRRRHQSEGHRERPLPGRGVAIAAQPATSASPSRDAHLATSCRRPTRPGCCPRLAGTPRREASTAATRPAATALHRRDRRQSFRVRAVNAAAW